MFSWFTVVFCVIGLATGQSFTANPANATVIEGDVLRLTCDAAFPGSQPLVTATNGVTVSSVSVDDDLVVFETNALSRQNNGSVLRCVSPADSTQVGDLITLIVQYVPQITVSGANITATEGDQVSLNVAIDANPLVTLSGISVTPNLPATTVFGVVSANTVSITIPNVARDDANEYTITASNSVGTDTVAFQLTVLFNDTTSSFIPSNTETTTSSTVTVTAQTTGSVSPTVSATAIMSSTAVYSTQTPAPTGGEMQSSATNVLASFMAIIFFNFVVFLFI